MALSASAQTQDNTKVAASKTESFKAGAKAGVGHDTEKFKAPDDVYAILPGCCKYERAK